MSLDAIVRGVNYAGSEEQLRTLFGAAMAADWRQAFVARGYGWHFDVGGFASGTDTGITGGGNGTVMDLDQPEFGISVPSGYTLIPLEMRVAARPGLQTTDSHVTDILLIADRTAAWAGDGTVTSETPLNLKTSSTTGCPATCFSAATADITDPVVSIELARKTLLTDVQGTAATVNMLSIEMEYAPAVPPMVVGPGAIYGYWGGSIAVVGFAQLNFLVVPTSLISGLS